MGGDKFQRQVEFYFFFLSGDCLYCDWVAFHGGEICGGFKYLLWAILLARSCKALNIFLQHSEGWEVIHSRDRWVFSPVCFVVLFITRAGLKHFPWCIFATCRALLLLHERNLTWSSLDNPAVACGVWRFLSGGRSHIQSAVGYFLPAGEVILLPYSMCDIATPGSAFHPSCYTTFIS